MADPYGGERMQLYKPLKPFPAEGLPLTSPIEPLEQVSGRFEHKRAHRHLVIRHPSESRMCPRSLAQNVSQSSGSRCRFRMARAQALTRLSFLRNRAPLVFTFGTTAPRRDRPQ
jgi:hypothetical protein